MLRKETEASVDGKTVTETLALSRELMSNQKVCDSGTKAKPKILKSRWIESRFDSLSIILNCCFWLS